MPPPGILTCWLIAASGLVLSFGFPESLGGLGRSLGTLVALYASLFATRLIGRIPPAARRRRPGR